MQSSLFKEGEWVAVNYGTSYTVYGMVVSEEVYYITL